MGDLNAWSTDWGSPRTTPRGETLREWAAEHGLWIVNQGSTPTFVGPQGKSIVDVTFASPAVLREVRNWRVEPDVETLSDHDYIRFELSTDPAPVNPRSGRPNVSPPPRWALKRLDEDALVAASSVKAWLPLEAGPFDTEAEAQWFRDAMSNVCDMAMPRAGRTPLRGGMYWWSEELADLRRAAVAAKRRYTRYRRRVNRDADEEATLYRTLRDKRASLRAAIGRAKTQQWEELLDTLDKDPWGRPYLMVRKKLRTAAPPLTETLAPELLGEVCDKLFPRACGNFAPLRQPPPAVPEWDDELEVSSGELDRAVKRLRAKNTAPGPDGVPGRAWVLALDALGARFRHLLTQCLKTGRFPSIWKEGALVLLRKAGRPADSPSAYRPICLLDAAGKLFERVIVARIVGHLTRRGPDLADCQYGFRGGRSTMDAIQHLKALSDKAVGRGEVLLAVSLDISNAFNTLPWGAITEALQWHGVPPYLVEIVRDYLRGRYIQCPARDGTLRRDTRCGVPQGSVLGPLLWNLGYNRVLRGALPAGLDVICYADDTLVVARGESWQEARSRAEIGWHLVVRRIEGLGLAVADQKTEAMWLCPGRSPPPRQTLRSPVGFQIGVGLTMKYLGLHLDSRWTFRTHFTKVAARVSSETGALRRIMPNLGGPCWAVRRLYLAVVRSIFMYGAPVWHQQVATTHNLRLLRQAQGRVAKMAIRGYRTTAYEAACVVAGSIPWDLAAEQQASVYNWRADRRRAGHPVTPKMVEVRRASALRLAFEKWELRIADPQYGRRAIGAIRPVLKKWAGRRSGSLSYRLVQVVTGHGCFGDYLHRIGREETARCHQCGAAEDSAQHTLEVCPRWADQRRVLRDAIGDDLSLSSIARMMLESEENWTAVDSFCCCVMQQKESEERNREEEGDVPPCRAKRRRLGRARAEYARQA